MPDDRSNPDGGRPRLEDPGHRGSDGSAFDVTTTPPPAGSPGRLQPFVWAGAAAVILAAILVVASCLPNPTPTTPTTTPATPTGSALPAGNGPVITAFQVIDDVSCSGTQASVPVSWATRDAQSVEFEVDNGPVSAGAGYPLDGIGHVPVPCDGRTHRVVLVASGAGRQVAVARQINTSSTPPPSAAPSIRGFDVLDDVTCTGSTVEVPAAWATQNAQAVNFSVDGQPLPAAAGFPVSGAGNIGVPCDGKAHTVTLTATGTGPAASLSRSVNTTVSSSGGTTTPATPTSTVAPATSTTR